MKLLTTTTEKVVTSVEVDMTPEEMLKEAVQALASEGEDRAALDPMAEAGYEIALNIEAALRDYTPDERLALIVAVMSQLSQKVRELRSET